jgi:hypothetical protein
MCKIALFGRKGNPIPSRGGTPFQAEGEPRSKRRGNPVLSGRGRSHIRTFLNVCELPHNLHATCPQLVF